MATVQAEVQRRLQLLDRAYSATFVFHGEWEPYRLSMVCDYCGIPIGKVGNGDTLGGLLNDLRDHDCPKRAAYGP